MRTSRGLWWMWDAESGAVLAIWRASITQRSRGSLSVLDKHSEPPLWQRNRGSQKRYGIILCFRLLPVFRSIAADPVSKTKSMSISVRSCVLAALLTVLSFASRLPINVPHNLRNMSRAVLLQNPQSASREFFVSTCPESLSLKFLAMVVRLGQLPGGGCFEPALCRRWIRPDLVNGEWRAHARQNEGTVLNPEKTRFHKKSKTTLDSEFYTILPPKKI